MKKADKILIKQKLKESAQMVEKGKSFLYSHYTTGYYDDFFLVHHGKGSRIFDIDGNEYIDFTMALGPLILGHAHPAVVKAICEAAQDGGVHSFGEPNEIRFAEIMVDAVPCADGVTFCNSGTEATMFAIKMARAYTKKVKIGKFEGCYHGTHDYAQISSRFASAGPVEAPSSVADFGGIPQAVVDNVLTFTLNQPETFDRILKFKDDLAAIIVEPIPLICPLVFKDFLLELREVTKKHNILLIFDEVITGFRLGFQGAQGYLNIMPDLATYGKIIGGGLPIGAIAGQREYMETLNLSHRRNIKGKVYITGTFSGNRITCAAGIATLEFLKNNLHLYEEMENRGRYIMSEVEAYAHSINFPFQMKGIASIVVPYFHTNEIRIPRDIRWPTNAGRFDLLRKYMLKYGICLGDSGAILLSTEHTDEDCDFLIEAFKKCLTEML